MYILDCDNLKAYGPFAGPDWCVVTNAHHTTEDGHTELDIVLSHTPTYTDVFQIFTSAFYVLDEIPETERHMYNNFEFIAVITPDPQ